MLNSTSRGLHLATGHKKRKVSATIAQDLASKFEMTRLINAALSFKNMASLKPKRALTLNKEKNM